MRFCSRLLVTLLFVSFLQVSSALADDIVFSLGAGDGVSVVDTLPFELLRVDAAGTLVKLKGGDAFRIQDYLATDLLRVADDGAIYRGGQLFLHTPGVENTFVGQLAGNTGITIAEKNVALGSQSLLSNVAGNRNTAIGSWALRSNTASDNSALGYLAMNENATGTRNSAFGGNALRKNLGDDNSALGYKSLEATQAGARNTAVGAYALDGITSGVDNAALGYNALSALGTGSSRNIAIGSDAGSTIVSGNDNIYIGHAGQNESGTIRIGSTVHTKTYVEGIYGSTSAAGLAVYVNSANQLGTSTSSARFKEAIHDMEGASGVLMKLRPVTFRYREEHSGGDPLLQYGLIAEEVAQVDPGLVAYDENGDPYSVRYQFLAPMLLNEYQRQQQIVERQSAQLAEQENLIVQQRAALARMEARLQRLEERGR